MAEVAPAPVDPPAAKPKKKTAPRPAKKSGSPSVKDLIIKIASESKDRKGVSTALLKKQLAAGGYDVDKNKARIRITLKSLVTKGTLTQTTGIGASGSFKLAKGAAEPKMKKKKAATPSKATPTKKSTSKSKVTKKARSPQKAKTAAKKKVSPKKKVTKKKAAKPTVAKKAPAVKSKRPAASKSPKAKKPVPKKAAAKKVLKPKVKKAAAKK